MTQNTVSEIIDVVCMVGGVGLEEIVGSRRTRWITRHRQIAMHLARERTVESALNIAHQLGRGDHTTVLHADRVVAILRQDSADWRKHIEEMIRVLDDKRKQRSMIECPQVARFPLAPQQPKRASQPKFRKPSNDDRNEFHNEQKKRTCMTRDCRTEFLSKDFGDRFCKRCKTNRSYASGFDARLEGATV